jgi:hypothetical protein
MTQSISQVEIDLPGVSRLHWGAIWAGVFTFIAIGSVFDLLGAAIFAGTANPSNATVSTGIGVGMAIWAIIVTIIAMYVAGRVTGSLARLDRSGNSAVQGMIMFGLSVASIMVLAAVGNAGTGAAAGMPHPLAQWSGLEWTLFLALFFGWLAAMGGASTANRALSRPAKPIQEIRPAA